MFCLLVVCMEVGTHSDVRVLDNGRYECQVCGFSSSRVRDLEEYRCP